MEPTFEPKKRVIFSLLLLPFFLVFQESGGSFNYTQLSSLRVARIQKYLDRINKPPVSTIQSPDGDIIDCVHKKRQLALNHPLLKNHRIQSKDAVNQFITTNTFTVGSYISGPSRVNIRAPAPMAFMGGSISGMGNVMPSPSVPVTKIGGKKFVKMSNLTVDMKKSSKKKIAPKKK